MRIDRLVGSQPADVHLQLAAVLVDCVAGGASVGFLDDLTHGEAAAWWASALRDDRVLTWVARDEGRIVGTVRLVPAAMPNGRHRAEISKLLVHRRARGRGVAAALMSTAEEASRRLGRRLLVLDTRTGSDAERLYERWGWQRVGTIPDFAADPDGRLAGTTIFTKRV